MISDFSLFDTTLCNVRHFDTAPRLYVSVVLYKCNSRQARLLICGKALYGIYLKLRLKRFAASLRHLIANSKLWRICLAHIRFLWCGRQDSNLHSLTGRGF
jgi:hypothetical protein